MINLIIADDHKIFIDGIRTTLYDVHDINITGQAMNGAELLERLENIEADVVLLDINMPDMDGLQAAEAIKKNFKDVKIIMLTQYGEKRFMKKCKEMGVEGYLLKDCGKNELVDTIINVYKGGMHYSAGEDYNNGFPVPDIPGKVHLTVKELQVLKLIAGECCNADIAKEMGIETNTVRTYKERLMAKVGVKTPVGLVKWAIENNLL